MLIEAVVGDNTAHHLFVGNDEVSSCLEKKTLSAMACEEKLLMWTLHHAVILKGNCRSMSIS